MKLKRFRLAVSAFFLVLLINLVSAQYYSSWSWYDLRPEELLNNEWFVFGGIFAATFAVVYYSLFNILLRKMRPPNVRDYLFPTQAVNKGPVVVISLVIALFVAGAVSQRTYFYGYLGEAIGSWVLFAAFVILSVLAIFGSFRIPRIGGVIGIIVTFILWLILRSTDPYTILPSSIAYEAESVYNFLISPIALGIIVIIGILMIILRKRTP